MDDKDDESLMMMIMENLSIMIPALLNGLTENGKAWVVSPALWQCWPHLLFEKD